MSALQYYDFSGKTKFATFTERGTSVVNGGLSGETLTEFRRHNGEYDSPTKIQESMKNFEHDGPSPMDMTTTNLITKNLYKTSDTMKKDEDADYSTEVKNPYGYGYIASLNEMRNNDAKEIQHQESNIFALGAVAGVSLIVFGLLISSSQ